MSLWTYSQLLPAPLLRWVQKSLYSMLRLRWRLATGIELEISSRTDWTLYNDIFVEGEYDEAIRAFIRARVRGHLATVVDLGANVGFFNLRLFHLLAFAGESARDLTVLAIEPSPANLAELARRMQSNPVWAPTLRVVPGLVGAEKSGKAALFESHNYGGNTLFEALRYPGARTIDVDYVDLGRLIPDEVPIDLLKCDIEGAELDFAEGNADILRRVGIAVFEVHHEICDASKFRSCLHAAGLRSERILADRGNTSVRMYVRDAA